MFGFLNRIFGRAPGNPVPEWAEFFSYDEYETFLGAIRQHFVAQGRRVVIRDGVASVADSGVVFREASREDDPPSLQYGLQNLAQLCHGQPQEQWADIIAKHFTGMEESQREMSSIPMDDYNAVRDHLAIRLYPQDFLDEESFDRLITREDIPGIRTTLVLDSPHAVSTISREAASVWQQSDAALFDQALKNLNQQVEVVDHVEVLGEEGLRLSLLSGSNFLTSSHALNLHRRPNWIGKVGTLVGIPTGSCLIGLPIENRQAIVAIQYLIPLIAKACMDGPNSVSHRLYWLQTNGTWMDLTWREENDSIVFTPPEEFTEAIGGLGDAGE
jgi:hypothetical protein